MLCSIEMSYNTDVNTDFHKIKPSKHKQLNTLNRLFISCLFVRV